MNYYLKYLKYKQKYLDLKNLVLNGGFSFNNYNDLEGGILGLRPIKKDMIPYQHYNPEIEKLAEYWKSATGPVSYQTGYNREKKFNMGVLQV
jgi:hypothetical protein